MGLINHCAPLSTSEVGLNFGPEAGSTDTFGPGWWHQPGLKGALIPVGATNRDQCPSYIYSTWQFSPKSICFFSPRLLLLLVAVAAGG